MSSSLREAITVARKELKDRPPRSLLPDEVRQRLGMPPARGRTGALSLPVIAGLP